MEHSERLLHLLYLHDFALVPIGHWLPGGRPNRWGVSLQRSRGRRGTLLLGFFSQADHTNLVQARTNALTDECHQARL